MPSLSIVLGAIFIGLSLILAGIASNYGRIIWPIYYGFAAGILLIILSFPIKKNQGWAKILVVLVIISVVYLLVKYLF